jgi:hypothetical protein
MHRPIDAISQDDQGGYSMNFIRTFAFIAVTGGAALTVTPALAASCSSLQAECMGYGGSSQTTSPEAKRKQCQAATASCKAQCKQGQKAYISPFTGKQYPVDSCN